MATPGWSTIFRLLQRRFSGPFVDLKVEGASLASKDREVKKRALQVLRAYDTRMHDATALLNGLAQKKNFLVRIWTFGPYEVHYDIFPAGRVPRQPVFSLRIDRPEESSPGYEEHLSFWSKDRGSFVPFWDSGDFFVGHDYPVEYTGDIGAPRHALEIRICEERGETSAEMYARHDSVSRDRDTWRELEFLRGAPSAQERISALVEMILESLVL